MRCGHSQPQGQKAILDENTIFLATYKAVRMRELFQAFVRVWLIRHTQRGRSIAFK